MKQYREKLDYIKKKAKRVYPSSLKYVKTPKYKIKGLEGYLLLDDERDLIRGNVPILFYSGKWYQDIAYIDKLYEFLKD